MVVEPTAVTVVFLSKGLSCLKSRTCCNNSLPEGVYWLLWYWIKLLCFYLQCHLSSQHACWFKVGRYQYLFSFSLFIPLLGNVRFQYNFFPFLCRAYVSSTTRLVHIPVPCALLYYTEMPTALHKKLLLNNLYTLAANYQSAYKEIR